MSKEFNPEDIMSMDDTEFEKLDTQTMTTSESTESTEDTVVEETLEETNVVEETHEEPSIEEDDQEEPIDILALDDEEFEKLDSATEYNKPKSEEEDVSTPAHKVPTIEELQAKVEQANKFKEANDKYIQNRDVIDTLEANDLLDKNALNTLINVKKGNKEAIVDLLKQLDISPKELFAVKEEAKKAVEQAGGSIDDEDDFDAWFNGISDDSVETKKEPEKTTAQEEQTNQEESTNVDHFDELAKQRVGETAREVIQEYGQDTLNYIDTFIDPASYEIIKKDPQVIRDFADQHKSGVMNMINDRIKEMDARGYFPEGFPYINKYRLAGDALVKEAQFIKPIDRKVGSVRSTRVDNIEHAQTINTSTGAAKSVNITPMDILMMSDEEFEKFDR